MKVLYAKLKAELKSLGIWVVTDNCSLSGMDTYSVTVGAGASVTDIAINDFWEFFINDVNATISGDVITIPRSEPDADSFYVEGTGTYDAASNTISFSYDISREDTIPAVVNMCTSTWAR